MSIQYEKRQLLYSTPTFMSLHQSLLKCFMLSRIHASFRILNALTFIRCCQLKSDKTKNTLHTNSDVMPRLLMALGDLAKFE
uniref:Uncharacterized protein n=1 Tax=Pararge aegeria TaxID=116150 RepID=S4PTU5_9NEOP